MRKEGRVLDVSLGRAPGAKQVQSFARIGPHGIQGDCDEGLILLSGEQFRKVGSLVGTELEPGVFGEHLLTEGLGELGDIHEGTILSVMAVRGPIVLRAVAPHPFFRIYHPEFRNVWVRLLGVRVIVEDGIGEVIHPEDPVTVFS